MINKMQIYRAKSTHIGEIQALMKLSIEALQKSFLTSAQIKASHEVMGLDTQLIEDGTYCLARSGPTLVGCGGWSMRNTLYGGNHSKGRNAELLDPNSDAARIRAMYTHPDWARRGIGRLILDRCEQEARNAGFKRAEMMATLAGVPLYEACGYREIEKHTDIAKDGTPIPLVKMGRLLD
jgi:GNAT superfamily N-acetyltransferase